MRVSSIQERSNRAWCCFRKGIFAALVFAVVFAFRVGLPCGRIQRLAVLAHPYDGRARALQRPKSHFSFRLGIFWRGGLFNPMMFNLQSELNMPQKPPLPMS
jgi:hypothetical protein